MQSKEENKNTKKMKKADARFISLIKMISALKVKMRSGWKRERTEILLDTWVISFLGTKNYQDNIVNNGT